MPTEEAVIMETFFRIADKDGKEVPFRLNSTQRALDENLTGRDLIPKARQEGISSYFLGRYTAKCLYRHNTNAVIVSHESEATQRLLQRCRFFLNNMEGGKKPIIGRDAQNAITFPETNSSLWIGTAGSRAFGRGDTIHALHCSEYAYWPDAGKLMMGLNEAVPLSGEIAIESTGNGIGNDYYKRCIRARDGASHYHLHFFDWKSFPEYRIALSPVEEEMLRKNLRADWEEVDLYEHGILDLEQIAWRRIKLEDMDYDLRKFKQEYPLVLEECFQSTGRSLFYRVNYVQTQEWILQDMGLHVLNPHPISGRAYTMGVDPSGGVGGDNSCIQIFDTLSKEQVAEWADNKTPPDVLAHKAAELGAIFNHAFMVVESNNHGIVVLHELRGGSEGNEIYPLEHVYESGVGGGLTVDDKPLAQMGLRTTTRSKPLMIGKLRTAVARDWKIHSSALKGEMDSFVEKEGGKIEADDGCLDDRVIAAACALWGAEWAELSYEEGMDEADEKDTTYDPFSFEEIIKSINRLHGERETRW